LRRQQYLLEQIENEKKEQMRRQNLEEENKKKQLRRQNLEEENEKKEQMRRQNLEEEHYNKSKLYAENIIKIGITNKTYNWLVNNSTLIEIDTYLKENKITQEQYNSILEKR
jgi:hypothetical protein